MTGQSGCVVISVTLLMDRNVYLFDWTVMFCCCLAGTEHSQLSGRIIFEFEPARAGVHGLTNPSQTLRILFGCRNMKWLVVCLITVNNQCISAQMSEQYHMFGLKSPRGICRSVGTLCYSTMSPSDCKVLQFQPSHCNH